MITAVTKQKLSVKTQTIGAFIALISAVALPQIVHVIGKASGIGVSLGEILSPMHLPIILVGFLAGPYAAGIAGLLSPLISSVLTDMPSGIRLPFMMIELCAYGVCAGVIRNVKLPMIAKVVIVQIAGRIVRFGAVAIGFYVFDTSVQPTFFSGIRKTLFGIILQLIIIPLAVYRIKNADD